MSTARDLIRRSLLLIGAIAPGETPSADESSDALKTLNEMLDSWSNENLIINAKTRETFPLIPGKSSYTMGPSGDFNTLRPVKIDDFYVKDNETSVELPVASVNQDEWNSIRLKGTTSALPISIYAQGTAPLYTLNVWPVPSSANLLGIVSSKPLGQLASLNTEIELPPGYLKAIRYNLAIELCPEYGREPSMVILKNADEGRENIKRTNIKPTYMETDMGLRARGMFNINTGE